MISEECLLFYRYTRNTTLSTSTSNFGSSGRVDRPLLETHSLLTRNGSQVMVRTYQEDEINAFLSQDIIGDFSELNSTHAPPGFQSNLC